jgi:hypothetical protein
MKGESGSGCVAVGAARDDQRMLVRALFAAKRDAPEVEHQQHVGVRELELQREPDDVEVAQRPRGLERHQRKAALAELFLHVAPRGIGALGQGRAVAVQDPIEDLEPEVAHPDVVQVRKRQRDPRSHARPVLALRAVLSAEVAHGLLDLVDEARVGVVLHRVK